MNKIIIIDDEKLLVDMYTTALRKEGFEVENAPDGKAGIEKIKSFGPDLVLLDIMMPELTGLDMLDVLKKDPELKKIPVVMLTNLTWVDDKNSPIEKGALDIWIKANNKPQELIRKVKKFFEKRNK